MSSARHREKKDTFGDFTDTTTIASVLNSINCTNLKTMAFDGILWMFCLTFTLINILIEKY